MGTVNSGERHYYNQHKLTQWIPLKEQLLSKLTAARWRLTRLWRTRISSSTTSRPTGVLPADSSLPRTGDLTWLESSPSKLSRDGRPEGPLFIICHHTNQHYCKSFYHHFA